MNIRIDPKSNEIYVSAGEIAFFARTKSESVQRRNLFISTDAEEIPQGGKDLFLAVTSGEIAFTVTGTADLIYRTGENIKLEKFRQVGRITGKTHPFRDPAFLAEGFLCAYMLCQEEHLPAVTLRLTYTVQGREIGRAHV